MNIKNTSALLLCLAMVLIMTTDAVQKRLKRYALDGAKINGNITWADLQRVKKTLIENEGKGATCFGIDVNRTNVTALTAIHFYKFERNTNGTLNVSSHGDYDQ